LVPGWLYGPWGFDKCGVGSAGVVLTSWWCARWPVERSPSGDQRNSLPGADRRAVAGSAGAVRAVGDGLQTTSPLVSGWDLADAAVSHPDSRGRRRRDRLGRCGGLDSGSGPPARCRREEGVPGRRTSKGAGQGTNRVDPVLRKLAARLEEVVSSASGWDVPAEDSPPRSTSSPRDDAGPSRSS